MKGFTGEYDRRGRAIMNGDLLQIGSTVYKVFWHEKRKQFMTKQEGTGHIFWLEPAHDVEIILGINKTLHQQSIKRG